MCFLLEGFYRVFFSLSILVIIWRVQHRLKPYKKKQNNNLEILGINVAIITLNCGLIFDQDYERSTDALDFLLLLLIFLLNLIFILQWIAIYIIALGEQHPYLTKIGKCIQTICFIKIKGRKPLPVTNTQKAKPKKGIKKGLKTAADRNYSRKKKLKRKLRNKSHKKQVFPRRDKLNDHKPSLLDENIDSLFNDSIKRVKIDHSAFKGNDIDRFLPRLSQDNVLFE